MRTMTKNRTHRRLLSQAAVLAACAAITACAVQPPKPNFSGAYVNNPGESLLLPGEQAPANLRYFIRDHGERLEIEQTYTGPSGELVRLRWSGACDEEMRPVEGALFGAMSMSCRREDGALVYTVAGAGWRYSETCVLISKDRMTCSGAAPDSAGRMHPFRYVFDRGKR